MHFVMFFMMFLSSFSLIFGAIACWGSQGSALSIGLMMWLTVVFVYLVKF